MIYEIKDSEIVSIEETSFEKQGLKERSDLQRLLKNQVEILSPNLLVVSEEFNEWEESRRSIDLLAIDKAANIVVIELKRTEDGGHMELQAIRYAAMVSTLTFDRVVDIYRKFLAKNNRDEDPRYSILEFLDWQEGDEDQFAQDVRIILASAEFSKEITTTVMWLNSRNLDIRCVRLKPYRDGDRTLLDVQTVIPLPEAEAYQVRIKEKQQQERRSRQANTRDTTRYDVSVNGKITTNQTKRGMMFHIIAPIINSGVTPEQLSGVVSSKKSRLFYKIDGELIEEQVVEHLMAEDTGGRVPKYRRYYSKEDELFRVNGKTYVLTNQWGGETLSAVEELKQHFLQFQIGITPVS